MALLAFFLYALLTSSFALYTKQSRQYADVAILNPAMDDLIEEVISSWNSPGGAGVAVVKQHEDGSWQVETKGYGIASVAEQKEIDADSLFYIGSNSKLLTAISGGLLVANESLSPRISWDTKIADLLPESIWKLQDSIASAETTITDAMSHRTGLPDHVSSYSRADTIESLFKKTRHLKPSASFRSTWQYNNIMYCLLGYLPTAILPQKPALATYLKKHVFDPLGMTSATYSLAVAKESGKLVDPTAREGINKTQDLFGKGITRVLRYPTWFQEDNEDGGFIAGAGGAIMSVKDVASWLQVLLLEGQNPQTGEQVIPQEVIRKVSSGISVALAEPQYPEMSNVVYGGGLTRASYRGNDVIEHTGAVPGYLTSITRLPNSKLGVAVLTNDDNYGSYFMDVIKWRIIDEVLGLEPIDWDSRMRAMVSETYQSQISTRPTDPTPPPVPFEQLPGLYRNLGYGDLELCYVSAPPLGSESESCRQLREDQPVMLPDAVRKDIPTFLARWDRFWYSYVKLEHIDGALFSFHALESYPTNDTSNPYWTYVFEQGVSAAEIAREDGKIGFGMIGGFWVAGPGVADPVGDTAKERSEVWFEKI